MKVLVIVLACVAASGLAAVAPETLANERSVSSNVVELIEAFRDQMPCGFPGLGLPVMAPFRLSHQRISLGGNSTFMDGDFRNIRLDGLDQFDIEEFQINLIRSRADFNFYWKTARLTTDYKVGLGLKSLNMNREGDGQVTLMGFRVFGRITYSFSVTSRKISVKTMKIKAEIEDVKSEIKNLSSNKFVNKKMNQVVEEWIMLAVNENTDQIGEITDYLLTPIVNSLIGDMTLDDLISGGGGGGEGEPVEKEQCIPSDDYVKFP